MGLLDDLLGQLAAGGAPQQQRQAPPAQASGGMGMGSILMALMPVVLMMLRSRGGNDPSAGIGRGSSGGGLGGLGALLEQFQRAGFGDAARSWVSSGDNQPMPSGALDQVFGPGGLAEIARRAGLSEADTSRGLAQLMPEVINHVTPSG